MPLGTRPLSFSSSNTVLFTKDISSLSTLPNALFNLKSKHFASFRWKLIKNRSCIWRDPSIQVFIQGEKVIKTVNLSNKVGENVFKCVASFGLLIKRLRNIIFKFRQTHTATSYLYIYTRPRNRERNLRYSVKFWDAFDCSVKAVRKH